MSCSFTRYPHFFCIFSEFFWRWNAIAVDKIVNEGIRARELRLIADDGSQLGVKSKQEALKLAEQANLDLVLVAPKAKPPVAKIMDYGKYRFGNKRPIKTV